MALKLSLGLKQKMAMSQRLQQSLSVLSLSHEELNQAIQEELLENPLLETQDRPALGSSSEKNEEIHHFRAFDFFEPDYRRAKKINKEINKEPFVKQALELKSYIEQQVETYCFPKNIKIILSFLISSLDERGYLDLNLEELSHTENIPLPFLQKALKILQSLEPAGLAARSLEECLLIQLKQKKQDSREAGLIVNQHLQNIKNKKFKVIAYDLNISLDKTLKICQQIQSLEPHPGRNFVSQPTCFPQPDLYIYKQGSDYRVVLNRELFPELKFSHKYAKFVKEARKLSDSEKKYLSDKSSSARCFIRSIQQRQETIKKIAYKLIQYQREFFEKGPSYLQALKMQDLADQIAVHVSTISRAVHNKYVHTPQGMFPLKSFFQKGLINQAGVMICKSKIKKSIKQWIQDEDSSKPLSDAQISERLYKVFHIHVQKRSVSQYRSSMGIPPIKIRVFSEKQA